MTPSQKLRSIADSTGLDGIADAIREIANEIEHNNAPAVPQGWKLVPVEPTEAMSIAGGIAWESSLADDVIGPLEDAWAAMLGATPAPTPAQEPETALQKFTRFKVAETEGNPVEMLRAFCAFAMNSQDWFDVEPFFDLVREAMASRTAVAPAQGEPFGYFRAEPFGWTDCAKDDEGAIALYERPAAPAVPQGEPVAWLDLSKMSASAMVYATGWKSNDKQSPLYTAAAIAPAQEVSDKHEREMLEVIDERDRVHEWADQLADAIAKHTGYEIGEHTSENNPWRMALNALVCHEANPAQEVGLTDEQKTWAVNQLMEQAQVFASAWSLVGGRHDFGNALEEAEQAKTELRSMVVEALRAKGDSHA